MEFDELIKQRKSVRKYKQGVEILKDEVEEILKALQYAPSWKNSQTGRYYVALSKEAREDVFMCLPTFNQNNTINCSCYFVTTFIKNRSGYNMDETPTNELGNMWGSYDLGLQNQLLILKAKELGYDSLIMGIRDSQMLKEKLAIPDDEIVVSVIALGKKDVELERPKRKDIEEISKIK